MRLKVAHDADYHLTLKLAAAVSEQKLELFLDGHAVGFYVLAPPTFALAEPEIPTTVYARLPVALLPHDGLATLEFKFSKTDADGKAAKLIGLSLSNNVGI